ncbi:MAG: GTP cyclohydrolase FolE2 [Neisseria sp.]|nr:GTP cyclohydrolase FolE2 [Neisseria sp.]
MNAIADVQSSADTRNQPIYRVGIKDLRVPLKLSTLQGVQHTVASVTMAVYLPAEQKGTHMSRFVALIEAYDDAIDYDALALLTRTMLRDLASDSGEIQIRAPFFRTKSAPISGIKSLMDYDLTLTGEMTDGVYRQTLQVVVPVTSLCPCSKEISDYGAHNQRSHVTVSLCSDSAIDPEEVIDLVEKQASCQLYGLLKRPDEKYVTEYAYDNPKFVEDIVRDVAAALKAEARVHCFVVESENFESIHNHSAYAKIVYP